MTKTVQSPAPLLLKTFRNLKLAIIFKIFLLFYLLLNLIILSKNVFFIFALYIVGTHFEAQTQYVKGYRPSEPNTIYL